MATQYIGARYVPIFADPAEWNDTRTYEPLTVVLHGGNSYTSKQYVPVGIAIDDSKFWAETGNYNAQIEQYRQDVVRYATEVNNVSAALNAEVERATAAEKANADAIAAEVERATAAEKVNADAIGAERERATAAENGINENKAPTNHASANTMYGVGNENEYGHVKLTDVIDFNGDSAVTGKALAALKSINASIYICANRNNQNNKSIDVYWTDDFVNYHPLTQFANLFNHNQDFVYLGKIGSFYYIFCNSEYAVSSDFKNWTVYDFPYNDVFGTGSVYGYKVVENTNKCIGCCKISDTIIKSRNGANTYYFQPYICDYVQKPTGELTFTVASPIVPPSYTLNSTSYIDPDVIYKNGVYYIVFKDEIDEVAILYTAKTLEDVSTWSKVVFDTPFYGYEAPKLYDCGGKISMIVSYYSYSFFLQDHITGYKSPEVAITNVSNFPAKFYGIFDSNVTEGYYEEGFLPNNRHLGIMPCDLTILSNYVFVKNTYRNEMIHRVRVASTEVVTYTGPHLPNTYFYISEAGKIAYAPTSIKEYADFTNVEKYVLLASNTNSSNASFKVSGEYASPDIKDVELNKTNSQSPTAFNLYPSTSLKLAINVGGAALSFVY